MLLYLVYAARIDFPDNKVHDTNMEPIWGQHDPGGPHVGPMNFAIWVDKLHMIILSSPNVDRSLCNI